MKSIKFLLLMLFAFVFGSGNVAYAQTWTDITDENVSTSEDNLLANPSFETLGTVKDGAKYNIGAPWTWSIGSANVRVEKNSTTQTYVLVWRGSGNSNYISQPLTGIKPNTCYEVKMSQVASGNANANFNVGIGTGAGKYDVASNTVRLGTNNNGIKTVQFVTPATVDKNAKYYFTFANTTSNTASSGSDPVTQLDWISMVECYEYVDEVSGTYYLYNEESGQFYSRGNNWGTRSITDQYGYPVNINPAGTIGTYTIKMLDASQSLGLGNNLFTDNGSPVAWTFEGDATNGYAIYCDGLGYLSVGGNHQDTKCVSDLSEASKWKLVSAEEHKSLMKSLLGDNKVAVAAAAGISGITTEEDFDKYIQNNYVPKDYTSKILSASLTNSNAGWTWTQQQDRKKGSITTNENGSEIYQGVGNLTQNVTGLDEGIYKVTIQGFYRDGSNANCVSYDKDGWQMSNMYFQGNEYETRIMGWAENRASDTNPNSMGEYKTLAEQGKYVNTFYTYVGEDGNLSLCLGLPSYPAADNGFWAIFSNVTLSYYSAEVSDEDAEALIASVPEGTMYEGTQTNLDEALSGFQSNKTIANYNALLNAINAANASIADYNNLKSAIDKVSYQVIDPDYTALATAKETAQAVYDDATVESCEAIIAALDAAVKAAKVNDFMYVTGTEENPGVFQYGVELGTWTKTGPTGELSDQHWSGKNRPYLEQSSAAWGQNSWTIGYNQDLTLPAGNYVFKVAGRKAAGDGCTLGLVVTNKTTTEVLGTVNDFPEGDTGLGITTDGVTSFDSNDTFVNGGAGRGFQWRYVKFTLNSDAIVNVAVNAEATKNQQWVSFCDATVQTDNDANIAMIAYNIALNDAKMAISDDANKNVTGAEKTAVQTAIAADMNGKTKAEVEQATSDLKTLTEKFIAAASAYDEFVAYKAKAENLDDDGQTAFNTAMGDAITAYEDNTVEASQLTGVKDAYIAAIKAQTTAGSDWTGLIVNPSFEENTDVWNNGWTTDRNTSGTFDYKLLEETLNTNGTTDGKYVLNAWAPQINHIYVQQSVKLPVGAYKLSAAVYSDKVKDQHVEAVVDGVQYKSQIVSNNVWETLEVEFVVTEESDVTIGIFANGVNQDGNTEGWFRADNFKLTYIGNASATMSVSATAQYGTFIAPFDVAIPEGVKAYSCYVINGNTLDLNELSEAEIPANTPVILYAENGYTATFYGISTATDDAYENGYLTGVFAETKAPAGSYVLQNGENGVKFYVVEEGKEPTVKANRCYLNLPEGSDVKAFGFSFGEADAINSINADKKQMDGAIYNLNGQRLNSLQKGINIVNGKKLFVK